MKKKYIEIKRPNYKYLLGGIGMIIFGIIELIISLYLNLTNILDGWYTLFYFVFGWLTMVIGLNMTFLSNDNNHKIIKTYEVKYEKEI